MTAPWNREAPPERESLGYQRGRAAWAGLDCRVFQRRTLYLLALESRYSGDSGRRRALRFHFRFLRLVLVTVCSGVEEMRVLVTKTQPVHAQMVELLPILGEVSCFACVPH